MTLMVLRSADQVLWSMYLNFGLPDVFLSIRQGLWVFGKDTMVVECVGITRYPHSLTDHLVMVVFIRFLHFFSCSMLFSLETSH